MVSVSIAGGGQIGGHKYTAIMGGPESGRTRSESDRRLEEVMKRRPPAFLLSEVGHAPWLLPPATVLAARPVSTDIAVLGAHGLLVAPALVNKEVAEAARVHSLSAADGALHRDAEGSKRASIPLRPHDPAVLGVLRTIATSRLAPVLASILGEDAHVWYARSLTRDLCEICRSPRHHLTSRCARAQA